MDALLGFHLQFRDVSTSLVAVVFNEKKTKRFSYFFFFSYFLVVKEIEFVHARKLEWR